MKKEKVFFITDLNAGSKEIATPQDYIDKLRKDRTEKLVPVEPDASINNEVSQVVTPNPTEKLPVTEMGTNLDQAASKQPESVTYPNPNEPLPVGNIFDTPDYQVGNPTTEKAQLEPTTPDKVVDIPINIEATPKITDASQIGVEDDKTNEVVVPKEDIYLMYMVKENDDIYKVSLELGVSPEDLTKRNGLNPTDKLIQGTMLFVPIMKNKLSKAELKFFQSLFPKMQNFFVENTKDEYQSLNGIGEMQL